MKRIACVLAAVVIGLGASLAQALVILDPTDFVSGTDVSTSFNGVVMSTVGATSDANLTTIISPLRQTSPGTSPIYAASNTFSRLPFSVLWSSGPCCSLFEALRIDFLGFASELSVQFLPDDNDAGLLAVFGPSGEVLADLVGSSSSPFTLSFTGTGTPIAYALASYSDTGYIGTIEYAQSIPEPATLALVGIGLVGLSATRRRSPN